MTLLLLKSNEELVKMNQTIYTNSTSKTLH